MALWDSLGSLLWEGPPSRPKQQQYSPEGYFGWQYDDPKKGGPGQYTGGGAHRVIGGGPFNQPGMDQRVHSALVKKSRQNPGFSRQQINAMQNPALASIGYGAQAALARANRGDAVSGAYGGGGALRGRGDIMQRAANQKANVKWNTEAMAAKVALDDTYRTLQMMEDYTRPRLGMLQGEHGRRLGYQQHLNNLAFNQYQSDLAQYNREFEWSYEFAKDVGRAIAGGAGGGGGGMGG